MTLCRPVTRQAMSAASANELAPSYMPALAASMPVISQIMLWYS